MAKYRDFDPDNLAYDPETGLFTWMSGNRKGMAAGSLNKDGYLAVRAPPHRYMLLHRVAFLKMTGAWPTGNVDHKNRVRTDNRWANLRILSHAENQTNQIRKGTPTPGAQKYRGRWRARIKIAGRDVHLGYFASAEDASAAYLEAKARLHPRWTGS